MIIDHCRDKKELFALFKERPMNDGQYSFNHIINNPNLFCFYGEKEDNRLKGFIFITQDDEKKLYLSGASVPKNMSDNIDAIITICNAFKCDIYSNTDFKHAGLVLRRAGFKKIGINLYRRKYNG